MSKLTPKQERINYFNECLEAKRMCVKELENPNASNSVKNIAMSHISELNRRMEAMLVLKPLVSAIKIACLPQPE